MYVLLLISSVLSVHGQFNTHNHECNTVTIPMCLEMPYNTTRMPNLLRHQTQEEAAIMAHEFLPLVDIKCSPFVRFFICSVFAPMCSESFPFGVPSCRSVCLAVRSACLPVLQRLSFAWPSFLLCDSFPEEGLCMMPPDLQQQQRTLKKKPLNLPPFYSTPPPGLPPQKGLVPYRKGAPRGASVCSGPRIWVQTKDDAGVCVPLCQEDFLFAAKDKRIAMAWASSWALVSLISTSFSLLTFALNRNRFDYPERPVICLALSYFFYSLPFILRLAFPASALACETDPASGQSNLAASGVSSPGCIITFLLQYYFGIASELWWTILTFCWFMTSCRFWGSEGLKTYATYFHALAWGIPALASVAAITLKQVNGDELLGICFVGTLNPWAQLYLVILPQGILLTLGTTFIGLGFISLFRIRNAFRREFPCGQNSVSSPSTSLTTLPPSTTPSTTAHSAPTIQLAAHVGKLERLMLRLGVFSVLSTLPALFVLGCRLHAHFKHQEWAARAAHDSASCETGWNKQSCGPRQSHPQIEIELLKIFMSLIIGVTSGIWVWSRKTITLWKLFLRNLFGLKPPAAFLKAAPESRCAPGSAMPLGSSDRGDVTRGYVSLQDSWNPLLSTDGGVSHPHQHRCPNRVLTPPGAHYRNYVEGHTSSELTTSFV